MSPFIETIRIEKGEACRLAYHTERMNRTRKEVFGLSAPLSLADRLSPAAYRERTKCRIEYAEDILKIEYLPYQLRPVRTLAWTVDEGITYTYKSSDRSSFDRLQAARGAADDILIVRNGRITDTSICNVALWNGTEWITPEQPLLAGTHRAYLIHTGQIRPGNIGRSELSAYTRIRLFNAMIDFGEIDLPLTAIQGI